MNKIKTNLKNIEKKEKSIRNSIELLIKKKTSNIKKNIIRIKNRRIKTYQQDDKY